MSRFTIKTKLVGRYASQVFNYKKMSSAFYFYQQGKQTTLKKSFQIQGAANFSGREVIVECDPAEVDTGVVFLINGVSVKARLDNIKESKFHTVIISNKDEYIMTIEHILSAFYCLNIDNVVVKLKGGNQLPGLDSSAKYYAKKILDVGLAHLSKKRDCIKIGVPFFVHSDFSDSWAVLLPSDVFKLHAFIDFNNLIGAQDYCFSLGQGENYYAEISRARSFFIDSFNVKRWRELRQQFKTLPKNPALSNIITYNSRRFITKLRYPNEPVRHKMLDFFGDISLLGHRLIGEIIVYKPGHIFTRYVCKKILEHIDHFFWL